MKTGRNINILNIKLKVLLYYLWVDYDYILNAYELLLELYESIRAQNYYTRRTTKGYNYYIAEAYLN